MTHGPTGPNELAGEDEHDDGEETCDTRAQIEAEGGEDDEEPCRAREKVAGVSEQPPLVGVHASAERTPRTTSIALAGVGATWARLLRHDRGPRRKV